MYIYIYLYVYYYYMLHVVFAFSFLILLNILHSSSTILYHVLSADGLIYLICL